MKILWLTAPALILAMSCVAGPSTETRGTNIINGRKLMIYQLRNLQTEKVVKNPTDEDIKTTVGSLKDDYGPVLALETDAKENNQPFRMDEESKGRYSFVCLDGETAYFSKGDHPAEVAIKVIISYRDGTDDWKKLVEWKTGKL